MLTMGQSQHGQQPQLELELGNTAERVGEQQWKWQAFLDAGNHADAIREVVFRLHETFRNPTVRVACPQAGSGVFCSPPHTGWGTFEVKVEIHWKTNNSISAAGIDTPITRLAHELNFRSPRTAQRVVLSLPSAQQPAPAPPCQARVPLVQSLVSAAAAATAPAPATTAAPPAQSHGEPEDEPDANDPDAMSCEEHTTPGAAGSTSSTPAKRPTTLSRAELERRLEEVPYQDPAIVDLSNLHGRAFRWHGNSHQTPGPEVSWRSTRRPREDKHGNHSAAWLTATEYEDRPEVLKEKVGLLAALLLCSQKTVAYTGAGISVAAGIGQAAAGSAKKGNLSTSALPTKTHHALAALSRAALLHGWVQQNHDGLPQKAGFPQEAINEIHGSWYDPSNPVVLYSGSLRGDLCSDMRTLAETADLALVLGTSLSGLNADQVATKPGKRSLRGKALGTCIISPQRTPHDGLVALRIFGKSDAVMQLLAEQLGTARDLEQAERQPRTWEEFPSRLAVPYDEEGRLLHSGCGREASGSYFWDLRPGQQVVLAADHNVEGAGQPAFKHITSKTVGRVIGRDPRSFSIQIDFEGAIMSLGLWWLDSATRGAVPQLPVVNVKPEPVGANGARGRVGGAL